MNSLATWWWRAHSPRTSSSPGTAAALANVGDSRAYLLAATGPQRDRTIQIAEDHLYRNLVAGAAEVPNLSDKLTRCLDGHPDGRSPDVTLLALASGDRILLCSDGLSCYVSPEYLHTTLATAQLAVDRLIASAGWPRRVGDRPAHPG